MIYTVLFTSDALNSVCRDDPSELSSADEEELVTLRELNVVTSVLSLSSSRGFALSCSSNICWNILAWLYRKTSDAKCIPNCSVTVTIV